MAPSLKLSCPKCHETIKQGFICKNCRKVLCSKCYDVGTLDTKITCSNCSVHLTENSLVVIPSPEDLEQLRAFDQNEICIDGNIDLNIEDIENFLTILRTETTKEDKIKYYTKLDSRDLFVNTKNTFLLKIFTPLHILVRQGDHSQTKVFLQNGANMFSEDNNFMTPYEVAMINNNPTITEHFEAQGFNKRMINRRFRPVRYESFINQQEKLTPKLNEKFILISPSSDFLIKVLFYILQNALMNELQLLLTKYLTVEFLDKVEYIPNTFNLGAEALEIFYFLQLLGLNVELRLFGGYMISHLSILVGNRDIFDRMVQLGSDIFIPIFNGETSLHIAASEGRQDILFWLLQKFHTPHAEDENGNTPLHKAIINGHINCAKILLKFGANINARNCDGLSALHISAITGNHEATLFLLSKHANCRIIDLNQNTPIHLAILNKNVEVFKILIKGDDLLRIKNKSGFTPVMYNTDPIITFHLQKAIQTEICVKYYLRIKIFGILMAIVFCFFIIDLLFYFRVLNLQILIGFAVMLFLAMALLGALITVSYRTISSYEC